MRPMLDTVRTLTRAAAVAAVACALLGTGTVTAQAARGAGDGSGSQAAGNWQDQGWNGQHQSGQAQGSPGHRPPAPPPHPTPTPKPAPTPKPGPGGEHDGQTPPVWWHPRPQPPVTGTTTAAHLPAAQPATPKAPHSAAPARHADTPPATGPGIGSSPAVVLALAASAPLAGIGARIGSIGGVVPLPGWGSLRSSLLGGGSDATAVLGAIVLAGSALLGLGAYTCTRLRRMLARQW